MKPGRAATSVVLVTLAVGALAYARWFDGGRVTDADRAARAGRVFPRFEVADVRSLAFEHDGERLVIERAADAGEASWALRSPVVEPADPATVDALLEDLSVAVRLRDVPSPPPGAGLSSPRVRGSVEVGSLVYDFELGASALVPDGASYMHMSSGADGTFVVGRLLTEDLLRGVDAYRDRILVPYGRSETSRLEVRGGESGAFVLTRTGATFRLDGGLRASRDGVDRLFAGLAEVRAASFVADSDDGPASGAEALFVGLDPVSASRARVELRVDGACPGSSGDVVVTLTGPPRRSACVPRTALDALRVTRESLVDRGLFRSRADEVAELRFEPVDAGAPTLELARRGNGWHERAPRDRDFGGADAAGADGLAERLASLRATDLRPGAIGDPFIARSRVTVVGVDGLDDVIEVGPPTPQGSAQARRLEDGAVLVLPKEAGRDLEPRPPM